VVAARVVAVRVVAVRVVSRAWCRVRGAVRVVSRAKSDVVPP
jgi:hypothetical protein